MDAAERAEREREELPISDEVRAELDRRLAAHRRNPEVALSWDELQCRLRVTPAEYLAAERGSMTKHQLWRGTMIAMDGASYIHSRIVANLLAELRNALRSGSGCVALPSDMKIHVPSRDAFVYPDASIVCGPPEFFDDTRDVLTNPAAVFEVLSDSTERFDRGEKFAGYRSIPSLREFVLISQHERRVEHYARRDDGAWVLQEIAGNGAVALVSGGQLELAGLHADSSVESIGK